MWSMGKAVTGTFSSPMCCETPQSFKGFTPFGLIFGRQLGGLLEIAKEAWESQPSPFRSVIEYAKYARVKLFCHTYSETTPRGSTTGRVTLPQ